MRCTNCDFENVEGAKFCNECGTSLAHRCPKCKHENSTIAKFCSECGARLTPTPVGQPVDGVSPVIHDLSKAKQPDAKRSEAERRQLTVMFTDLVGSTALSERLDPEDLRDVLHDYQSICSKIIGRYDGHLAKYLGDGLLVYFGYPQAHEDDAQRAVRAGLAILEAIERLHAQHNTSKGIELAVRVGIHTGLVVAGDMDREEGLEEMAIVGETPNIAARLQSLAEPNALVVSAATYRLVTGYFETRKLGDYMLKGISVPMEVFQVLLESTARSRLDVATTVGLTPLVGREVEIAQLLKSWDQVLEGNGQVVLLNGEAGIGKSRLVESLKEYIARDPQAWLTECRCSALYQSSPFYPIIELLEQKVLGFERSDSVEQKITKIEGFLVQYGFTLEEGVPLVAGLLQLPLGTRYVPLPLMPQQQKHMTLELLRSALLIRAETQPMLFVIEDLHWADPSTIELLDILVAEGASTHLLALFTFRPVFIPPWSSGPYLSHLTITRLSTEYIEQIISPIAKGRALPPEVLQQIISKSDGVPLFVEELTKMVMESGWLTEGEQGYDLHEQSNVLTIPSTLQDSLMARLDRLSAAKSVAQAGAAIGREFSFDLLQGVIGLDEPRLQHELDQLIGAQILLRRGKLQEATYIFKHALIQDAAYESLLKSTRKQYHQKIAQTLEERFPQTSLTQPELLAQHYTEAGLAQSAISYWLQAAQRDVMRSAGLEAIIHARKGLELIPELPDSPERARLELMLQTTLGNGIMVAHSIAQPEIEQAFTRALELCRQIGDPPELFLVLRGLWVHFLTRSHFQPSLDLALQMVRMAEGSEDPFIKSEAYTALGLSHYQLGQFQQSLDTYERGLVYYQQIPAEFPTTIYGLDPGVSSKNFIAWLLLTLGYPDRARAMSAEAVEHSRSLHHPYTTGQTLQLAASFNQYIREADRALGMAEENISFCNKHSMPFWVQSSSIIYGWALFTLGNRQEGIRTISQGITAVRSTGVQIGFPYFLSMFAEVLCQEGEQQQALAALDEAHHTIGNGEGWWESEVYRIRGDVLLSEPGADERQAEVWYHKAINDARSRSARFLQLRATVSLVRLLKRQHRAEEALTMLVPLYDSFSEGFNTVDLKNALQLLQELRGNNERIVDVRPATHRPEIPQSQEPDDIPGEVALV